VTLPPRSPRELFIAGNLQSAGSKPLFFDNRLSSVVLIFLPAMACAIKYDDFAVHHLRRSRSSDISDRVQPRESKRRAPSCDRALAQIIVRPACPSPTTRPTSLLMKRSTDVGSSKRVCCSVFATMLGVVSRSMMWTIHEWIRFSPGLL